MATEIPRAPFDFLAAVDRPTKDHDCLMKAGKAFVLNDTCHQADLVGFDIADCAKVTILSGATAAFMKRAVVIANRELATSLAEAGGAAQAPQQRGESAEDFLRALRDTKAKIHVDLVLKVKARRLAHGAVHVLHLPVFCQAAILGLYPQTCYPGSIPTAKLPTLIGEESQRAVELFLIPCIECDLLHSCYRLPIQSFSFI